MISTSRLRDHLVGDMAVFDEKGRPLDVEIPEDVGPATLVVSEITEAIKALDRDGVTSLDRDRVWAVDGFVLAREVLDRVDDVEVAVDELLDLVSELGYRWKVVTASGP